jgi:uncharacterized RDD family membrane protein YckC
MPLPYARTQVETRTPAPGDRRLEASLITGAQVVAWVLLTSCAVSTVLPLDRLLPRVSHISGFLTNVIIFCIIYGVPCGWLLIDGGLSHATSGMRRRRIRFVQPDGHEIGVAHAMLRIIVGWALIPLTPISVFLVYWHPAHRSLADLACGTAVWEVRTTPATEAGDADARPGERAS